MRSPTVAERVQSSPILRRRRGLARLICLLLARLEVTGLDQIPVDGPVVLAGNHRSLLDGGVLMAETSRPVSCLVKSEAFCGPIRSLLLSSGQIPVVRHTINPAPVRLGVEVLRAGGVLGVFPEGTRGSGAVRQAKPGVGYLALRSGAVVVPIALHGTPAMLRRRTLRRPRVRVMVGEPVPVPRYPDRQSLNRRTVAATTESIRVALAQLVAATGDQQ